MCESDACPAGRVRHAALGSQYLAAARCTAGARPARIVELSLWWCHHATEGAPLHPQPG